MLVFNRQFLPGFRAGGPIRSLSSIFSRLSNEFNFFLVTLDRDLGDHRPYPGIRSNCWIQHEHCSVMYLAQECVKLNTIKIIARSLMPDVIYLNSLFDPIFTMRVLLARRFIRSLKFPIILAPRGELAPAAIRLRRFKKLTYLRVAEALGLLRGLTLQASSEEELHDIAAAICGKERGDVHVAMDLTPPASANGTSTGARTAGSPLRMCFLARISPIKNLDYALRVLAAVKVPVVFSIYGPKEDLAYWKICEMMIQRLPLNVQVQYRGPLHPSQVPAELVEHDVFFLPTRGESYGHVIYEALAVGLPVLISDRTPWTDLTAHGAGWTLSLAQEQVFSNKIDELGCATPELMKQMKSRARAYAYEHSTDPRALQATRALFLSAISQAGSVDSARARSADVDTL